MQDHTDTERISLNNEKQVKHAFNQLVLYLINIPLAAKIRHYIITTVDSEEEQHASSQIQEDIRICIRHLKDMIHHTDNRKQINEWKHQRNNEINSDLLR